MKMNEKEVLSCFCVPQFRSDWGYISQKSTRTVPFWWASCRQCCMWGLKLVKCMPLPPPWFWIYNKTLELIAFPNIFTSDLGFILFFSRPKVHVGCKMGHTLLPAPAACPGLGWSGHRPLFLPSPVSSTQSQSLAAGSLPDQVPLSMNCTASIFSVFFQYFEGSFSGCPPPPISLSSVSWRRKHRSRMRAGPDPQAGKVQVLWGTKLERIPDLATQDA
jgi:hypothetical protein